MIGNLVGSYKITAKIGEGGMGAVFKGIDVMLEREVAIKMLRPELANNPQIVERFRSEAVTLAKLNHPNIATLYSFLRQGDDYFMVMEFVRGETLDDLINKSGAMSCDQAIQLFCQALEGIDHAHKLGIIHRDIKPANMMMTESSSLKVMDFGIARVLGTDRMTKTGHLIGTIEYMSPEQIRGLDTDARSDIYSLGILLYEMLTGRVPFTSTSEYDLMRAQIEDAPTPPRDFAPHVPVPLEQAIMRSLAKRPEARYQTAGEFRFALERSMRSATSPLDNVASGYLTRPDVRVATPPSREVTKETRLAPGSGSLQGVTGSDLKPTRLDSSPPPQPGIASPAPQQAAPQPLSSMLRKLNWKHYAGAGAVLLVLIIVPIALLSVGGGSAKQVQPAPAQQTGGAQPAAAPNPEQYKVQPGDAGPEPSASSQPAPGARSGDAGSASRSRDSRPDAASPGDAAEPSGSASASKPQETTATPKKEEKTAAAKEPKKDDKKKEGGFGGLLKKLNPFGKGEKDKKKP